MPEVKNYVFSHPELAQILIKHLDLHEGHWGGLPRIQPSGRQCPGAARGQPLSPCSVNFVNKIGIQRFDVPNNLSLDAAQVNPLPKKRTERSG